MHNTVIAVVAEVARPFLASGPAPLVAFYAVFIGFALSEL